MKGIITLHIEVLVSGTENEIEKISQNPLKMVDEECFIHSGKKILNVQIMDVELTDDTIDISKMLDARYSGE